MTRRRGPSTLFWTFAGIFLAVLILATVLQYHVAVSILRPLAERLQNTRAEHLAQDIADELSARLDVDPDTDVRLTLRELVPPEPIALIFYRAPDGSIISPRPESEQRPRFQRGVIERMLDSARTEPGTRRAFRRTRMAAASQIRVPVVTTAGIRGEVIAVLPNRPADIHPVLGPWTMLLFLPVALIIAGAGGILLLRLLLRRLRALENLALKVAEGNLNVRVESRGNDEIDRLGSQLNRMTERLAAARARVEAADQQRRRLLADISHELATPLTSIRGYAETLQQPEVPVSPEERTLYLQNILEESQRMGYLIDDLLELTRLESRTIELNPERLDLTALTLNTRRRFEPKFREAGLTLEAFLTGVPRWITADGRRVEQMLDNLLINALRYVPRGGTVTISLQSDSDEKPVRHRLSVSDTGPGFPPEDLPHVFDRFYRGHNHAADSGSGLGLAIVKEIAHRHNGSVSAANQPEGGAQIVVEFPAHS